MLFVYFGFCFHYLFLLAFVNLGFAFLLSRLFLDFTFNFQSCVNFLKTISTDQDIIELKTGRQIVCGTIHTTLFKLRNKDGRENNETLSNLRKIWFSLDRSTPIIVKKHYKKTEALVTNFSVKTSFRFFYFS